MRRILFLSLWVVIGCTTTNSVIKTSSKYLFSVDGEPHFADEFIYAFSKNNHTKLVARDSIDNYLDLYLKFRLKVKEAKSLGYDTTASFKKEFAQYKQQLDDSYLNPKKEQEALIKEAYDRSHWEVKASHILIEVKEEASPEDTLKAYEQISSLRNRVLNGEDFNQLARQFSNDPSAKTNGGELGYFSALQMVYPFENAAYTTPVSEVSKPVRTRFGYHLIKVEDKRKNEGKVQVAHIMVRFTPKDSETHKEAARNKIDKVDSLLKAGNDWNTICRTYSEDQNSANNNGMLRPFARGQIVPQFEEVAFSLLNPGDISSPVQTQYGWHIIKLIQKISVGTFEEERGSLARRVSRDSRSSLPKDEMMQRLKAENSFEKNENAVKSMLDSNDKNYTQLPDSLWLFKVGNEEVLLGEFRASLGSNPVQSKIQNQLSAYEDSVVINYEKIHLAEKYPDYKYLVNEYYDGILLFSIMEDSVWNKSMTDSLGLKKFFKSNKNNYIVTVVDTTLFSSPSKSTIDSVTYHVSKSVGDWEELKDNLLEEYNISPLTLHVVSKGDSVWNKAVSKLNNGSNPIEIDNLWYCIRIGNEEKPQPLDQVKGKLITDYQNILDKQWVERLQKKHPISVNKKELKTVYAHYKAN